MQKQDRILSLESLRGLAALSVALFHLTITTHLSGAFVHNPWLLVDLFFVLSGFVIARSALERIDSPRALAQFQTRRLARLYPLHLVMLLVFLGIETAKAVADWRLGIVANNPAFTANDAESFLANLLLLQNWLLPDLTWNYPSWSISAEFYTYAIFGLLALLAAGSRWAMAGFAALVVVGAGAVLAQHGFETDNIAGPARCLYGFFLGVLTHLLLRWLGAEGRLSGSIWAVAVLAAASWAEMHLKKDEAATLLLPPLFALLVGVLAATRADAGINRVLGARVLVFLGTVSFGIYMIHAAVWWVMNQVLRFGFGLPVTVDAAGASVPEVDNLWLGDLIALTGLAVTVGLAWLSHRYLEQRWRPMRTRLAV